MVKITYGHGFMHDGDSIVGWTATDSADPLTAQAFGVENRDYLKITGTCDAAADEYVVYDYDLATNISPSTYTKYLIRWKTSHSAAALGATANILFSDASRQHLINADDIPQFSTSWKVTAGTITDPGGGATIDKVELNADDYPDTTAAGASSVYYDFILLYKDDFTLPNTAFGLGFNPFPRNISLGIPSGITGAPQNLGGDDAEFTVGCDLDQGLWTRAGDSYAGQVFDEISHNASAPYSGQLAAEPWQWLNTELNRQFKVTTHPIWSWDKIGDATGTRLDVTFKEYFLGNKAEETYLERFGIVL